MAYLRDESEKLEIDYPLEKIWAALPEAVERLEWKVLEIDDVNHTAKLKTKGGLLSYGTTVKVEAQALDAKTCRMSITAETPVTTITAMADFGRTRDRIEHLVVELAKIVDPQPKKEKKKK